MLLALPAFWVGLLYDSNALDAAWDLVRDWTEADRQSLRDAVPREAWRQRSAGGHCASWAGGAGAGKSGAFRPCAY